MQTKVTILSLFLLGTGCLAAGITRDSLQLNLPESSSSETTPIHRSGVPPGPPNTISPLPNSTTVSPNITTTSPPTTTKPTTTSPTTKTTPSPPTTPSTTSTTPTTPSTKPTSPTSTSTQPTSPATPTSTPAPSPTPTKAPGNNRKFDGPSFVGGIVLASGLAAIGFVAFKFYKARTELNYHTL